MRAFEFEISRGELFCLAAIHGVDSLLNVQYESEETGTDLMLLFNKLTESLRNKKWLDEDFDGNMTVLNELTTAISLCGAADRFWIVQSHTKKDTVTDYIYTIYNTGENYLVLEQIDGENYKGLLTDEYEAVKNTVFNKTPSFDAAHTYTKILPGEISAITENEPYAIVSISTYTTETDNDKRALVCLDAAMFLLLKNSGSYFLSADGNDDGEFLPVEKTGGGLIFDKFFQNQEDV